MLNYRICVVCKSCFTDKSSIIIDEEDPKYHDIDQNLRRMTKLYVCHECNKFEKKEDDLDNELINRALNQIEFPEGDCLLIPSAELFSINDVGVGDDVWEDREFSSVGKNNIMFPTSAYSELKDVPISRTESINFLFNKCELPKKSLLGQIYFSQLRKYKNIVMNAKRYTGNIVDGADKTLADIKAVQDDSQIRGSDNWYRHQDGNVERRFEQYGSCGFKIEVNIPHNNEETVANSLLLEGISITISFIGDESLEQERRFLIHPNHVASELCPNEDCEKIVLADYLEDRGTDFDSIKYISTYLYSVTTQLQSLVENIVKCPSSELFAEDFYFTIVFDGDGVGQIKGAFWPKQCLLYHEYK